MTILYTDVLHTNLGSYIRIGVVCNTKFSCSVLGNVLNNVSDNVFIYYYYYLFYYHFYFI